VSSIGCPPPPPPPGLVCSEEVRSRSLGAGYNRQLGKDLEAGGEGRSPRMAPPGGPATAPVAVDAARSAKGRRAKEKASRAGTESVKESRQADGSRPGKAPKQETWVSPAAKDGTALSRGMGRKSLSPDNVAVGLNSNSPEALDYDTSQAFSFLPEFSSEYELPCFDREDYSHGLGWDSIMMMQDPQANGAEMMRTYSQNDLLNANPGSSTGNSGWSSDVFDPYSGPFSVDMSTAWLSSGGPPQGTAGAHAATAGSMGAPPGSASYQDFHKGGHDVPTDLATRMRDNQPNRTGRGRPQQKQNKRKRAGGPAGMHATKHESGVASGLPDGMSIFEDNGPGMRDFDRLEAAVNEEFPPHQDLLHGGHPQRVTMVSPQKHMPSQAGLRQISPQAPGHSHGAPFQQVPQSQMETQGIPVPSMFSSPSQEPMYRFANDTKPMHMLPGMSGVAPSMSSRLVTVERGGGPSMHGVHNATASREARTRRQLIRRKMSGEQKQRTTSTSKSKPGESQGVSKAEKRAPGKIEAARAGTSLKPSPHSGIAAAKRGVPAIRVAERQGNSAYGLPYPQVAQNDASSKAVHSMTSGFPHHDGRSRSMDARNGNGVVHQHARVEGELQVYRELFRVLKKLSDPLRDCIRDSLLRLSESARGRANASLLASQGLGRREVSPLGSSESEQARLSAAASDVSGDRKRTDAGINGRAQHPNSSSGNTEGHGSDNGSNRLQRSDEDKNMNLIDRSVANLLFYQLASKSRSGTDGSNESEVEARVGEGSGGSGTETEVKATPQTQQAKAGAGRRQSESKGAKHTRDNAKGTKGQ